MGVLSIGTYHFDRVPIFLKMTDNYLRLWFSYRVHYLHLLHNNNKYVFMIKNHWKTNIKKRLIRMMTLWWLWKPLEQQELFYEFTSM